MSPSELLFLVDDRFRHPVTASLPGFLGFVPGNGIHGIHMNQGNHPQFARDDGVWQDGGLVFRFPSTKQWVAIFLAFQSQAWHTDDVTGHAITELGPTEPDRVVRIVGALVNPIGPAPEPETITLLNTSPEPVGLTGWTIADGAKTKHSLTGTLAAGATVTIPVQPPAQLGNKGGIITLLDDLGLKVDGVSYTEQEAEREGWTLVF